MRRRGEGVLLTLLTNVLLSGQKMVTYVQKEKAENCICTYNEAANCCENRSL